jgi:multicomponent Na+:H+ antiporter subunit D
MIELVSPGLLLLLGALLLPWARGFARAGLLLGLPLITLGLVWLVPEGSAVVWPFLGTEIRPVRADNLARCFATVFAITAFAGGLFALRQASTTELVAALFYAGSAIGAVFAGDLITLFVFWELMALGSGTIIFAARIPESYGAGMRYMAVHLLGGVILMIGVIGYINQTGRADFGAIAEPGLARWLILIGFLINAGAPPLSAWLADAYPEASPSGMVFLSAFTTKAAVYALIRAFAGEEVLIYVGLYMAFYGIVYALLENDMRRILAYSIVNQVGFMVAAVGIGTPMALNGATAHAFAHIIYKALLLMAAGAVLYQTGRRKCTDLGGLFQSMPLTALCGIIGALSISSFPLTSGFTTKTMISQAAGDQHLLLVWLLLTAASAGVFLHAGIKFPWYVFFQKDSGLRPPEPPANMLGAMYLFSFLCIALGVYPEPLYRVLPFTVDYVPYTADHVMAYLQLLLFAGLAFFVMLPLMHRTLTITLDFDWFYRQLGPRVAFVLVTAGHDLLRGINRQFRAGWQRAINWLEAHHGLEGTLSRVWPTGSMVLWVSILFAAYLLLTYLNILH